MKNALTYLGLMVRFLCSLLMLFYIAVLTQNGAWGLSIPDFLRQLGEQSDPDSLFRSWNWVIITTLALALVVLTLMRIMNLVWNVAFNVSLIASLLYLACFGSHDYIPLLSNMMENIGLTPIMSDFVETYPVSTGIIAITTLLGILAASATFRISITALVCFCLWLGLTALADHIIDLWAAQAGTPTPDGLEMLLVNPWIPAAIIGTFFLIYSTLMSIFETFTFQRPRTPKSATKESPAAPEAPNAKSKPAVPAPEEPEAESKPAAPAPEAPKAEEKTAAPAPEEPEAETKA